MRALLAIGWLAAASAAHADVIAGKVVSPDGKPVGRAAIHVMLWFADGTGAEQRDIVAKPDGSFVVADSTNKVPVKIVNLVAQADGFTSSEDVRPNPGAAGVVVALRPAATVVLRVVDAETGAPVTHALITPSDAQHPFPTHGGVGTFANVDARRLTSYKIAAPGYASLAVWPTYQLGGDQVALPRRWPLALRLVDLAGHPFAHCEVAVGGGADDDDDDDDAKRATDAHGLVTVLAPHGDVAINPACSRELHEGPPSVKHVAGGGVQTLRVPPNQVFVGKVVDGAGKPVAGAKVVARGDEGQELVVVLTDARGAFRFDTFRARGFMIDVAGEAAREVDPEDTKHPIVLVVH